jgi:hypothetical protein
MHACVCVCVCDISYIIYAIYIYYLAGAGAAGVWGRVVLARKHHAIMAPSGHFQVQILNPEKYSI